MEEKVKSGVYRHYKGDFYQVLFTAALLDAVTGADVDLDVYFDGELLAVALPFDVNSNRSGTWETLLFKARAHCAMKVNTPVVVYVPLYANKPGRRISVRPVAEFTERVGPCRVCAESGGRNDFRHVHEHALRFTYVGDTIPETR